MQRMNNSFNHSLRPLAIFVSFVGLIYCVVRGASLLKDSTDSASELRTADIALGAIYLGLSVFELFGIIVAVKVRYLFILTRCTAYILTTENSTYCGFIC